MGRGRAAGALIIVFISGALTDIARGGDLVACEPQHVTGDGSHWAYRIVDSRECWYPGRPGKSKNELFWDRGVAPSARRWDPPEAETGPSEPPSNFMAAPPEQAKTPEATPEQWHGTAADQLLAFTCCWPEVQEPDLVPQSPLEPPAWPLALLPGSTRSGGLQGQDGRYRLAEWPRPEPPACLATMAEMAGRESQDFSKSE